MFDPATNISSPAHADAFCLLITARLVWPLTLPAPFLFKPTVTNVWIDSFGCVQSVIRSVRHEQEFIATTTVKSLLI
jgi:hypothetical protein